MSEINFYPGIWWYSSRMKEVTLSSWKCFLKQTISCLWWYTHICTSAGQSEKHVVREARIVYTVLLDSQVDKGLHYFWDEKVLCWWAAVGSKDCFTMLIHYLVCGLAAYQPVKVLGRLFLTVICWLLQALGICGCPVWYLISWHSAPMCPSWNPVYSHSSLWNPYKRNRMK